MKCPQCQHENSPGVKFCGECGARLETLCPSCQAANSPTKKFCHECGASLVQTPSAAKKFSSLETYTPKHLAEKILKYCTENGAQLSPKGKSYDEHGCGPPYRADEVD